MKSIYNEDGTHTKESTTFGRMIERVVKPVFNKYIKEGFSYRELSHEAQVAVLSIEAEYALGILCKKTKEKLKKKRVSNIIKKALADGKICEDKRGGCDNWNNDNGKKPFDCGGNPKPGLSYGFCLGGDDADDAGYSEDTYCEECTIKMLRRGN